MAAVQHVFRRGTTCCRRRSGSRHISGCIRTRRGDVAKPPRSKASSVGDLFHSGRCNAAFSVLAEAKRASNSVNRPGRFRYDFVSFGPTEFATFVRISQTNDALFIDATGWLAVGFPLANACVSLFPLLSLFRLAQLPGRLGWHGLPGGTGRPASDVRLANRGAISGPSTRHTNNRERRGTNRLHYIPPRCNNSAISLPPRIAPNFKARIRCLSCVYWRDHGSYGFKKLVERSLTSDRWGRAIFNHPLDIGSNR